MGSQDPFLISPGSLFDRHGLYRVLLTQSLASDQKCQAGGEDPPGFPDALDLMVVCVEAGIGLDAAINRVGEEMKLSNKVLAEEFRLLSLELRAGKQRRDALRNLATRTGLEDVSSLVSLLIRPINLERVWLRP